MLPAVPHPSRASDAFLAPAAGWRRLAGPALKAAAALWCAVAVLGQLMFAGYVALFYGGAALEGQVHRWKRVLPSGLVPGDTLGNGVVASHLLFAVLIIVGGAVQLLPQVRQRWPALHRWNGRVYLGSAAVMSLGGLFIVVTRKAVGDTSQHVAICVNALLILAFAALAGRDAMAGRFDSHRRWALRLYLAVAGVWFFRIGLMAWLVLNRGPAGFDPQRFEGPFLTFLAFAQYLLPLAVLELYFRSCARAGPQGRLAMAAGLALLTLLTALGIGAAALLMWLPRLR